MPKIGHHIVLWHGKEFPGVNLWSRIVCCAFSEKHFALYLFGLQIVNWFSR
ncbi:MAG: hypothetical protein ACRD20_20510 [Terriglobales bacterium]